MATLALGWHKWISCVMATGMLAWAGSSAAAETRAAFTVSVSVLAVARMEIIEQAPTLRITAEDIRRGFVDMPDATLLSITCNNPEGYAIEVHPLASLFRSIHVRWAGREFHL